ncbi:uncharacterized protein LOC143285616 [Babylonia areolata]|uniref:uncharacterized protein LOC143285616 n=1 Tax=Babylonia areolata TaxID=304850 RepID=UPI003FD3273A
MVNHCVFQNNERASINTIEQYFQLEEDGWILLDNVQHKVKIPYQDIAVNGSEVHAISSFNSTASPEDRLFVYGLHTFDYETGAIRVCDINTNTINPTRILARDSQWHIVDGGGRHQVLPVLGVWECKGQVDLSILQTSSSGESLHDVVTIFGGSSVWETSTFGLHGSALNEMCVTRDQKINTVKHTPPPFRCKVKATNCLMSSNFLESLTVCPYLLELSGDISF